MCVSLPGGLEVPEEGCIVSGVVWSINSKYMEGMELSQGILRRAAHPGIMSVQVALLQRVRCLFSMKATPLELGFVGSSDERTCMRLWNWACRESIRLGMR